MTAMMVSDLMREMIVVILKLSGPIIAVALIVGVLVSILQALTQVQEQSLSFVPKLLTMFIGLLVFMSFMGQTLLQFSEKLFLKITQLE
jgi:flagellar biosynthetic protein FliQ